MEKEDLIKKIEGTSLPNIEVSSHKEELRRILIEKHFSSREKRETYFVFRKLALATLSLVVLAFISFYLIIPEYTLAKAKRIALANTQVRELIEKGRTSQEIKVIKNKGYVLISPIKEGELIEVGQEKFAGILVEIDLREEKVSEIKRISPSIFLTKEEEEKAKGIAKENLEVKRSVPEEAEISEIRSFPSELRLVQDGEEIVVSPRERKATIIYELGDRKWEGKINMTKEKVENIEFLSREAKTDED